MKKLILILLALAAASCCKPKDGTNGSDGKDGASIQGPKGDQGDPGASIVGPQGPAGSDGASIVGPQGPAGSPGANGSNGQDATPVTMVKLCPGTPSYPSVFIEYAFCVNHQLYGTYSANGGFSTLLPNGTYSSNAIGSSCTFVVGDDCVVVPQ